MARTGGKSKQKVHEMSKKVVLVTGASSGIGLRTAVDLAKAGYIVYGGARRLEPMQAIVEAGGHALALDVTDDASMRAAVEAVLDAEGRIDVLVNNAGYGLYGAVEDIAMDVARRQVETNIFGLARMTQLVTPQMRAQGGGRIINISSIGGTIHTPLGAWYHGTKWFVEGFTNALRLELEQFGIKPILIAPGLIATGFTGVVTDEISRNSGDGAYAGLVRKMKAAAESGAGMPRPSGSEVISAAIQRAIEDKHPRTIYRAGKMSLMLYVLRRLLPHRTFDRMMMRMVK
jgi:NADP-dependent 3-hydroxy acid dehydrogenase YdfG